MNFMSSQKCMGEYVSKECTNIMNIYSDKSKTKQKKMLHLITFVNFIHID